MDTFFVANSTGLPGVNLAQLDSEDEISTKRV